MKAQEAYDYSKGILDKDYPEYERIVIGLIDRYGKDYNEFIDVIGKNIRIFQRKKDYIHNTFADSLLIYLFARATLDDIDDSSSKVKFIEFSPMWGWSTFLLLRAIRDSGKEKQVTLWSYELSKDFAKKAKKNLKKVSKHIAIRSLNLINTDALDQIKNKHDNGSIDFLLIDSDHSGWFARKYLCDTRVFNKCKNNATIHIHDFKFWLDKEAPEKWQEPIVLSEYFSGNEEWLSQRYLGQVFMLLGGSPDIAEIDSARRATPDTKYFSKEHNVFVRNGLPEQYWLGGTIANTNHPYSGSRQKGKTYLCGLALWIIPKSKFKSLLK